jgi:hypothetical protein
MGSWKFTRTNEGAKIGKLPFNVTHSTAATGTSVGYASAASAVQALASGTSMIYGFTYSIDDAATETCAFNNPGATTTAGWVTAINASCTDLFASQASNVFTLSATPSAGYSLEIRDAGSDATNVADDMLIGLKYGGTETIGKYTGADQSFGAIYLYSGTTYLGTSYVSAQTSGKVVFSFPSGSEIQIPVGSKIITMKADLSAYTSLFEGSTVKFTLGSSTDSEDVDYIVAKGASSGAAIGYASINDDSAIGALASEEMWLYATRPVLSLNSSSPSGAKVPNSAQEVFRFDVNNSHPSIDLNINAIRFSINNSATGSGWSRTYNLYKSNDPSTSIGTGVSRYAATTDSTTGWVTIYPTSNNVVGANSTVTYMLKADTSAMNVTTGNDILIVSIEDDDFYWDDGLAANANKKVSGLPVTGGTLSY